MRSNVYVPAKGRLVTAMQGKKAERWQKLCAQLLTSKTLSA